MTAKIHRYPLISVLLLVLMSLPFASSAGAQIPIAVDTANSIEVSQYDPDTISHIKIDYTEEQTAAKSNTLLRYLADSAAPRNAVREVSVTGYPSLGNWTLLAEVFERILDLEKVYWDADKAISKGILDSLEKNSPSCRLYYTLSYSNYDPYDERSSPIRPVGQEPDQESRSDAREAIMKSKALYSLRAAVSYGSLPNKRDMGLVFLLLEGCPNLKELDLSIEHFGCVMSGGQPCTFDFMSNPNVRFPPLEVLTISGYNFDTPSNDGRDWDYREHESWKGQERRPKTWPLSLLPNLVMMGINEMWSSYDFMIIRAQNKQLQEERRKVEPDGVTNLDRWLRAMDWSHLHTLSVENPTAETLTKLSGNLPNLTSLMFIYPYSHHTAIDFIGNAARSLQSITLQDMSVCSLQLVVDAITKRHSEALVHLSFHQDNAYQNFNSTQVSLLVNSSKKLRKLEIDLPRPPTETNSTIKDSTTIVNLTHHQLEIYNILATSLELEELILHYPTPDLGDVEDDWDYRYYSGEEDQADDIPDPFVNQRSVDNLFGHLNSKKEGKRLTCLKIFVGNWKDRYRSGGHSKRSRRRVAEYVCRVDENGLETCHGKQMRNFN
jgi:hypothetical protein